MASTNKLTDAKVSKIKPKDKPYKLADGGGLFLLVSPEGGRYWRLAYRFACKQKTLGLGTYPSVSLAAARAKREAAKSSLSQGVDPSAARQTAKRKAALAADHSFEAVAREWFERKHRKDVVEAHAGRNMRRMEMYLFPAIGARPIGEITPAELLDALQHIENQGTLETAHRVRTIASQVFRYAIPSGRAIRDVSADLKDALQTPAVHHHAAIIDPEKIGPLLRALDGYKGQGVVVSAALRLAPLLFVRPGELRHARWRDFRLDDGEWDYKPSKGGGPVLISVCEA